MVDRAYFDPVIKPRLSSPDVEYIGEINESQKNEFLGNALALMFTIDWPEPFGLAMIEALACGTPVIARPCGSVPEVLRNGVSAIIATEFDDFVKAVKNIDKISREALPQGVRDPIHRRRDGRAVRAHLPRFDQCSPKRIERRTRASRQDSRPRGETSSRRRPGRSCEGRRASRTQEAEAVLKVGSAFYVLAPRWARGGPYECWPTVIAFSIFDAGGDILESPLEALGLFHSDTRFLSRFELRIAARCPTFSIRF